VAADPQLYRCEIKEIQGKRHYVRNKNVFELAPRIMGVTRFYLLLLLSAGASIGSGCSMFFLAVLASWRFDWKLCSSV
jgi:hypothetical protein